MLRKILTTAILGISVLGVMAANAAAPGAYVTGQLGYADTHMGSKIKSPIMLPFSSIILFKPNLSNNGLAGRLAIGYQFTPNWAVELGYLQLRSKKGDGIIPGDASDPATPISLNLNQNAIDIATKGILPLTTNINVYGKLGVAYLTTSTKMDMTTGGASFPITADLNSTLGIAKHKWAPEAAVGVSYDITPNVSIDTSWTHIQPLGKNRPNNIDFVAVGVGYNFG
ncbi:MAG: outer membrane beta-barrel protein [Pseudomonadota bacterium]